MEMWPLGVQFILSSAVTLYFDPTVLDRDVALLRNDGAHIVNADTSKWETVADAHHELARMFAFPDYYGHNWDAFNDCIGDIDTLNEAPGVVMVLTKFDTFAIKFPDDAHTLLDIYATKQRRCLMAGGFLICLVQSDDPRLPLAPVGATDPQWNRAEWLDRNRGLQT